MVILVYSLAQPKEMPLACTKGAIVTQSDDRPDELPEDEELLEDDWPEDVLDDEEVLRDIEEASRLVFMARPFNHVELRRISLLSWESSIDLTRLLDLMGITPEDLRPVYADEQRLNDETHEWEPVVLPDQIETFEQLGSFGLSKAPFMALAKLLDKPLLVCREQGDGSPAPMLFTAFPDGRVEDFKLATN